MKTMLSTTAAFVILAAGAIAQEAPADPTVLPDAGTQTPAPQASAPDTMNTDSGATAYGVFADTAVRDLVGKNVLAQAGNDVGEVESIIRNGDEVQAVVGVGGFLGIGEHDVAIPLADFVETDGGLMLPDATEEDLEAMPSFDGTGEPLPMDVTVAGDPVEDPILPGTDATGAMTTPPATDG